MSSKMPNGLPAKIVSALRRASLVLLVLAAVIGSYSLLRDDKPQTLGCYTNPALATTTIDDLTLEIAREEVDKVKGLSDRECLGGERGMLFVYELAGDYCFWMKDMRFPIDMIWLDDDKKIVTIKDNVSPDTYPQNIDKDNLANPKTFCSDLPAQYILELNAGLAKSRGWQVGTQLNFSL